MPHTTSGLHSMIGNIWPLLLHLSTIVTVLLAVILISQILRTPRKPAVSMGWILVIVFVPLIGIPLYLAFGERKFKIVTRIAGKAQIHLPESPEAHPHPVHSLLTSLGISPSSENNAVQFHQNGQAAWQALSDLLGSARESIDIAIFILGDDPVGKAVLSRLTEKAAQGVQVRLLLDGVGSFKTAQSDLNPLIRNGGEVARFIPVLHRPLRGRTNLRNHRKMVIVDQKKVWTGGRNLAVEYLGPHCPADCWIDLSFCQQGPVISTYRTIFEADWQFAVEGPAPAVYRMSPTSSCGDSRVQVVPSGPDVADDPIYAAFLTACYAAEKRILIVTPYFIPNSGIHEALKLASLRGVDVELILPARSNHRLADIARNRYLRELVKVGARVWLFPDKMVHAKALVFDRTLAMAGSANMDYRSLFLNCEVMSCFYSNRDVGWLAHWIEVLRDQSAPYHPAKAGALKEMIEGLILLGGYEL
ncbi:MAG: cardiolipin synthase [Deltaproteobacteria bacterium]|nr:MAG: cardiolipin synthase [Deltaproteobacteria bacterium]